MTNLYCSSHKCSTDAYRDNYDAIDWSSDIRTIDAMTRYVCDCCGEIFFSPGTCCKEPLRKVE